MAPGEGGETPLAVRGQRLGAALGTVGPLVSGLQPGRGPLGSQLCAPRLGDRGSEAGAAKWGKGVGGDREGEGGSGHQAALG